MSFTLPKYDYDETPEHRWEVFNPKTGKVVASFRSKDDAAKHWCKLMDAEDPTWKSTLDKAPKVC